MTNKELLQMALDALNEVTGWQWAGPMRVMDEVEDAIEALRTALAQPEQEPVAWTRVSDGLPKSGVIVLACYLTRLGNLRRIRAHWIAAKTEETGVDNDFFEYDEETDAYYLPEGWYECIDNWDDYTSVFVCEGEVTHWMPLPPAPDEKYTAPPKREWVGLTDEEIDDCIPNDNTPMELGEAFIKFARAIEAKLCEKNK